MKRLKRVNEYFVACKLKNIMPQLKNVDVEVIEDYLERTNCIFYEEKSKPTPKWLRFTLPFALILFILMFLFLPINFIITGRWGYNRNGALNWFKSLNIT